MPKKIKHVTDFRRCYSLILTMQKAVITTMVILSCAAVNAQDVSTAVSMFVSNPLREIRPAQVKDYFDQPFLPERELERPPDRAPFLAEKGIIQALPGPPVDLTVTLNVPGISTSSRPADPSGAVGTTQYVQAVNGRGFGVFDKSTGSIVAGPTAISTLWQGTSDRCGNHDHGDPIVLYDKLANRWVISQFIVRKKKRIFSECVAVSTTDDATGRYNLYRFDYNAMPDYPKLSVWPDGYYASYKMFHGEKGSRACAFEREKMLAGASAGQTRQICFHIDVSGITGLLPADFDGGMIPPAGASNIFARRELSKQQVSLRRFRVDWANPSKSTFGKGSGHDPDAVVDVSSFKDSCPNTRACVAQRGTARKVDDLGNRLMFRNAYRRFEDHETIVLTHSVAASPVAIRWYEIRDPNGTPSLYQEGTFNPDQHARWMASIASDRAGNIALGYSISSSTRYPGINVAVRTPDMPLGVLGSETQIVAGAASQTSSSRWGDYSQLTVDPQDECTFWYTAQYIGTSKPYRRTRIVAFRLGNCSSERAEAEETK